jgi:hypothetical protein
MSGKYILILLAVFIGRDISYGQLWEQMNGPGIDRIFSSKITRAGDIFVYTHIIHRSTDGGQTWKHVAPDIFTNERDLRRADMFEHPSGSLFIATEKELRISTDRGDSWSLIKNDLNVNCYLSISPMGTLFLATPFSFSASTDQGRSWDTLTYTAGPIFADSSEIFYSSYGKRSTNGGTSWQQMLNGAPPVIRGILSPKKGTVLAYGEQHVYLSPDSGRIWSKVYSAGSNITSITNVRDSLYLTSVVGVIDRSLDGGESWHPFDTAGGGNYDNTTYLGIVGDNLYMKSDRSLMRRSTLGKWDTLPIPTAFMQRVAASPKGDIIAASRVMDLDFEYESLYWRLNNSDQWESDPRMTGYNNNCLTFDSSGAVAGIFDHSFSMSVDTGWTSPFYIPGNGFELCMALNKEGHIFISSTKGMYRSTDKGMIWDQLVDGIDDSLTAVAAANNGMVYAAGVQKFYRSTDYGLTWAEVIFPFISGSGLLRSIAVVGSYVVVGVDRTGTYFSYDHGLTWENHSTGLATNSINQILLTPSGVVFGATDSGLYEFSPSTKIWSNSAPGMIYANVSTLTLATDGTVYAGTSGSGVYRSTKTYGTWFNSSVATNTYLPDDISIYPNPASIKLTISFVSGAPEKFKAVVYSLLGEALIAENNQISLDVSSLHTGQYFLRIFTEDKIQTLPLSIIK